MFARNRLASLALPALFVVLAGCAVPLTQKCKGWFSGGMGTECIDEKRVSFIVPGMTTKDDVIRNLGFPSRVLRNGSVYAYDREMGSWLMFIAAGGGAAGFVVSKDHLLLVEFDPEDRVIRSVRKEGGAALEPEFPD